MSQKVCICGREISKNKPLLITINACKNKHPPSYKIISKTDKNDKEPPNEHDEPEKPQNEKMQETADVLQSRVEHGNLSPISEKSSQPLARSTQTFGQPSSHKTSDNSKSSSKTSSKSIIKEASTTQESHSLSKSSAEKENQSGSPLSEKNMKSLSKSVKSSSDKSNSSRTGNEELGSLKRTSNNSKSSFRTSSKTVIKETSTTQESQSLSKSSAEKENLSGTPLYEKSVQSLSKSVKSYADKSSSSRAGNEELGSMKKTSNNSKSSSKTSSKSILKVISTQKSNNFSQTLLDQKHQSGSPTSGKSVQSLTKTTRTSLDKSGSSGKFSPKKLSFNENEELRSTSTQNAQAETRSLEEAEEAQEQKITDHILFCEEDNLIRIRSRGISEETICGSDGFVEKIISPRVPYKVLEHPRGQNDKNTSLVEPRTTKQKLVNVDVDEFVKDKMFNFPADETMKLPRLTPRYHGPGCALEIDVLEKHGKKCSYKKQKNPERNPADDKVGGYDVIGRVIFKTCGGSSINLNDTNGMNKTSNKKLSELYSLLHLPVGNKTPFILNASTSDNRVDSVKSSSAAIITTSKSFPNNHLRNTKADGYWRDNRPNDLEDLYFSVGRADKSSQMKNGHQKKWYSSLFSCFFEKNER